MSGTWLNRVWQEFHTGNLTRAHRDVLLTLRSYRGHGGLICPSHETLADRAGCHESTVWRALQAARDLGLVEWAERRVRAAWRWLRTSNRYTLLQPEEPAKPRQRTNMQKSGGGERKLKQAAHNRTELSPAEAQRGLAAIAARREAQRWAMNGGKHRDQGNARDT